MPVITMDTTVRGVRRDDVLEWLGQPGNHRVLLEAGFDEVRGGPEQYNASLRMPGRAIEIGYTFGEVDASHGGRRVRCTLSGRRTTGRLSWSLRTTKPSRDTLVTLHADYRAGRLLGPLLDQVQTRQALEAALRKVLEAVPTHVPTSD